MALGVPHKVPLVVPNCRPPVRFGEIVHEAGASPEVWPVNGCMVVLLVNVSDAVDRVSSIASTGANTSMLSTNVAVAPEVDVTVTV